MLARFKAYVNQEHLLTSGEKVLLAVSGGRDSVAMADMFHRAGLAFAIAHCNFHLRPGDCDRDQRFVCRLAEGYGVPFFTTDFDTHDFAAEGGYSVEEAARLLRYGFFADICRSHGFTCVATAHHRDDSIETFFLNLFRGTGISGLHGIRPVSTLNVTPSQENWVGKAFPPYSLTVIRPMLPFSRADIDAYVSERGLEYVEDSTNYELDARRNRIRLQLMPLLRELYPSVDSTMQANIDRLHDTELVFRAYVDELRGRLVLPYEPVLPMLKMEAVEMLIDSLKSELEHPGWPTSTAATLMFELLRPYGFNAVVASSLLRSLDAPSGTLFHSQSYTAEIHRGKIIISGNREVESVKIEVENVDAATVAVSFPTINHKMSAMVDADQYRQPFTVRPWRDGDRFRPFGMKGSRLVSDFLKDNGLPLVERRHVQLLVDADDKPLWLIGLRADERTRVTADTCRVLHISLRNEYPSR